jgi:ankyrin repeat protein
VAIDSIDREKQLTQSSLTTRLHPNLEQTVSKLITDQHLSLTTTSPAGLSPLYIAAHNNANDVLTLLVIAYNKRNVEGRSGVDCDQGNCCWGDIGEVPVTEQSAAMTSTASRVERSSPTSTLDSKTKELTISTTPTLDSLSACATTGQTPLHACCSSNNAEGLKILLLKGRANPNITDQNGISPLAMAEFLGNTSCVKFLQDWGYEGKGKDGFDPDDGHERAWPSEAIWNSEYKFVHHTSNNNNEHDGEKSSAV